MMAAAWTDSIHTELLSPYDCAVVFDYLQFFASIILGTILNEILIPRGQNPSRVWIICGVVPFNLIVPVGFDEALEKQLHTLTHSETESNVKSK